MRIANITLTAFALLAALFSTVPAWAAPADRCVYQTTDGRTIEAASLSRVPRQYQTSARCGRDTDRLARPEEIQLEGNIRRDRISTPLGPVNLRWPRKVEVLFGRTPLKAMADAARTVKRAVVSAGFPTELQSLNVEWQVVFMDADLPETQIPAYLVSSCHPGWMTPPANIYIVAQRVAGGCSGARVKASVADGELARVLVHEMGHAVEFYLTGTRLAHDRMRSEGFATWFEGYAAGYSSMINAGALERITRQAAAAGIKQSPNHFQFQGSFEDYARAALYFQAVQDRRGVRGIMDVYATMLTEGSELVPAIKKTMAWTDSKLNEEVLRAGGR